MGFEDKQFQDDRAISSACIPFLGGRPVRDTAIGQEDITNLLITLNTTYDVTDFLAVI
jgi:hypothetical protein